MVELKIYLSEGVNEKFRKAAMKVYGYGRGSLSKAAEEALNRWCLEHGEALKQVERKVSENGPVKKEQSGINPDERQSDAEKSATISDLVQSKSIAEHHS